MTEKIPNFEDMQVVDNEGNFTPPWKNIMSQLITFLQQNHSQEGLISPVQSAANITKLSTTKSIGAMIYNIDSDEYDVCIKTSPTTAVFKKVTTSSLITI